MSPAIPLQTGCTAGDVMMKSTEGKEAFVMFKEHEYNIVVLHVEIMQMNGLNSY